MSQQANPALIIAGMHRSGTSMVSSYLNDVGIDFGNQLLSKDEHNPEGYFEDQQILDFQRTLIIEACKGGKEGWPDWGFTEDHAWDSEVISSYKDEARELLEKKKNSTKGIWAWKEPRSTLLLDFWADLMPESKFLLLYRNPWEVKRSIKNLNADVFNKHPEYAYEIWSHYNKKLLEFYKANSERCLLVSSNAFLTDPNRLVQLINEKFRWHLDKTKAANFGFYNGDLFYSEVCRDELEEFKQSPNLEDELIVLNKQADLPGEIKTEQYGSSVKVSVVIPCYNQGQFIEHALYSVEKSLNKNYEIIIVNDGSDDALTIKKLEDLKSRGYNVIDQDNKGLANARNTGVNIARGEYVLPLDSDNKIDPIYLSTAIEILDKEERTAVVYSNCRVFGSSSGLRKVEEFNLVKMLVQNSIDACAVIRKKALKEAGGFDERMSVQGYEDWELWLNLSSKGWKLKHVDKYLFDYRVADQSMSTGMTTLENRDKLSEYLHRKYKELYTANSELVLLHYAKRYAELEQLAWDRQAVIENLQQNFQHYQEHFSKQQMPALKDYNIYKEYQAAMTYIHQRENPTLRVIYWTVKRFFVIKLGRVKNKLMHSYHRSLELMRKARNELKPASANAGNESMSAFRVFMFLVSKKGRARIGVVCRKVLQHFVKLLTGRSLGNQDYDVWREKYMPSRQDLKVFKENQAKFSYRPLLSIIIPVYEPNEVFLKQAIGSVQAQVYDNWELCIVDDASPSDEGRALISKMADQDKRIKYEFRKSNGHIAACSNTALQLASGEFIAFLDHDDMLSSDALYQMARTLNEDRTIDLLYSDEDKVDENGRFSDPYFKPDWSPDSFLARNYINHLTMLRKQLVDDVGGFREGYEGAQDFDLLLRITELTNRIHHIPKVLYHWRMHDESTALNEDAKTYAFEAGVQSLDDAFARRNINGKASIISGLPGYYQVRYTIDAPGKVSIVIPSKDQTEVLKVCIDSIINKSTWTNYEIILISNNSTDPLLFELAQEYKARLGENFKFFEHNIDFNYSEIINFGVSKSNGQYLALLNNDTEIITEDWMEAMMEQSQRGSIGAVGVKLLYHNNTIQHAGVVIGLGGVAGHTFIGKQRDDPGYYYYIWSVNNYSSVTAACMMCSRKVFDEVGGFDENLAVEYNDVDFCLKLADAGYNNVYLPHVTLYHYESLSRGHPHKDKESYARHVREIGYFKDRWQKYIDHDPCYNPNLSKDFTDFRLAK